MKHLISIFAGALLFSCQQVHQSENNSGAQPENPKPRNIIFMVGDGMGLTQISAGMIANGNKLNLEKFTHIGLIKTQSSDKLITDSAAGATAFSVGKKTYNSATGVDKDTIPVETILETAKINGLSTGLVVTSSITHATPACYYAHQPFRYLDEAIAADLLDGDVDVFVGGGRKFFANRTDTLNLLDSLRAMGYFIVDSIKSLTEFESDKYGIFIAEEQPVSKTEGRGDILTQSIPRALKSLSKNEKGFFMMIEGSQIDWGGHANNSEYIISEMIDFDNAIGEVLRFAEKDGNTLVVVTADHECGGYAITAGDQDGKNLVGAFTSSGHTPVMVPVFAFGPGAERFSGIYENTGIYDKMMQLFGFK